MILVGAAFWEALIITFLGLINENRKKLPDEEMSINSDQIKNLENKIEYLDIIIKAHKSNIEVLGRKIETRDATIINLQQQIKEKDDLIQKLNTLKPVENDNLFVKFFDNKYLYYGWFGAFILAFLALIGTTFYYFLGK